MSVEQYAEHRGLRLTNTTRRAFMPGETKGELADKIDEIESLIDEALDAELSRERVIAKIKEMRDVVEGEDEEESDLDEDDDSSDSDDDYE